MQTTLERKLINKPDKQNYQASSPLSLVPGNKGY